MLKVLIVNKLDIKIARNREIRKDSFIPEHRRYIGIVPPGARYSSCLHTKLRVVGTYLIHKANSMCHVINIIEV